LRPLTVVLVILKLKVAITMQLKHLKTIMQAEVRGPTNLYNIENAYEIFSCVTSSFTVEFHYSTFLNSCSVKSNCLVANYILTLLVLWATFQQRIFPFMEIIHVG
jgi:hypothetical protein